MTCTTEGIRFQRNCTNGASTKALLTAILLPSGRSQAMRNFVACGVSNPEITTFPPRVFVVCPRTSWRTERWWNVCTVDAVVVRVVIRM